MAGSVVDWDSKVSLTTSTFLHPVLNPCPRFQTVIGQKARGPTVTKSESALNAARRSGAAIETDKKGELACWDASLVCSNWHCSRSRTRRSLARVTRSTLETSWLQGHITS